MSESPLQQMKRLHGTKEALVDSLLPSLNAKDDEDKAALKARMLKVSNAKLLKLSGVTKAVSEYGGVDGLAESLAKEIKRAKDGDFVAKLKSLSQKSLLDKMRAAQKVSKRS